MNRRRTVYNAILNSSEALFIDIFLYVQFIQEDEGLAYVVSGSGNFVDRSTEHQNSFPEAWLRFYNADISTLGGFAYLELTQEKMFTTYFQPHGECVYKTVLPKRKL
ncbi:UNVERIFIED_CONTAM: hypothetical protein FKN15_025884 [Acipenser sinensis]